MKRSPRHYWETIERGGRKQFWVVWELDNGCRVGKPVTGSGEVDRAAGGAGRTFGKKNVMKTHVRLLTILTLGAALSLSCRNNKTAAGYEGGSRDTDETTEESQGPPANIQKSNEPAAGDTIEQENGTRATNASNASGSHNYGGDSLTKGKGN